MQLFTLPSARRGGRVCESEWPRRAPGCRRADAVPVQYRRGIYPFHQRRSSPHEYGINVACIEGMSPFDFEEVPVNEGQTHPKDRPGGGSGIAGCVRYESNADTSS